MIHVSFSYLANDDPHGAYRALIKFLDDTYEPHWDIDDTVSGKTVHMLYDIEYPLECNEGIEQIILYTYNFLNSLEPPFPKLFLRPYTVSLLLKGITDDNKSIFESKDLLDKLSESIRNMGREF